MPKPCDARGAAHHLVVKEAMAMLALAAEIKHVPLGHRAAAGELELELDRNLRVADVRETNVFSLYS